MMKLDVIAVTVSGKLTTFQLSWRAS